MSGGLRFSMDTRAWDRALRRLGSRAPAVFNRALKRGATAGKTHVARAIRDDTGVKVSTVKKEIKTSTRNNVIELSITGSRLPLIDFRARGPEPSRGKGGGVKYRIGKRSDRLPRAFIAQVGSHRGVFKRRTKERLPIYELFGPSLVLVFRRLVPDAVPRTREVFMSTLTREAARIMGR